MVSPEQQANLFTISIADIQNCLVNTGDTISPKAKKHHTVQSHLCIMLLVFCVIQML